MPDEDGGPRTGLFRVFVSSTFADLGPERRALEREVFRPLGDLCRRGGARFQAVDLRWGISEAAAGRQATMAVCLQEVRRCLSASPWFHLLAVLGERRGWMPVPASVDAAEYDLLVQRLSPADRGLVDDWYELDDNGLPPVRRLRPSDGLGAVRWTSVERRLHDLLAEAATASLPPERRGPFLQSAVEQELEAGLFTPAATGAYAIMLSEASAHGVDPGADRTAVAELKHRVRGAVPPDRRLEYERVMTDGLDRERYLTRMLGDVRDMLTGDVQAQLDRWSEAAGRPGRARTARPRIPGVGPGDDASVPALVGRDGELAEIAAFLSRPGQGMLALTGEPGTGKTAVLSATVGALGRRWGVADGSAPGGRAVLVFRALGTSPEDGSASALVPSLVQELEEVLSGAPGLPPTGFADAVRRLADLLGRATPDRPVRIVLDALDQLSDAGGRSLAWLPDPLPADVRVVVSALAGEPAVEAVRRADHVLELGPLSRLHGGVLLDRWLAERSRTLAPGQRAEVLSRFAVNGRPLWLRLAVEQCRHWRSTDEATPLPVDVSDLVRDGYERWGSDEEHGRQLVRSALGLLSASDGGLAEDELLDALSDDEEVMAEVRRRSAPAWRAEIDRLPVVLWAQLYTDMQPYLTGRTDHGVAVLDFYHRELREAGTRWAGGDSAMWHRRLARLFEARADPEGRRSWAGPPRDLEQVALHLEGADDISRLVATLTDLVYVAQVCRTVHVVTIVTQGAVESRYGGAAWVRRHLLQALGRHVAGDEEREQLGALEQALRRESDVLSRRPGLFGQQVLGRLARSGTAAARALVAGAAGRVVEDQGLEVIVAPAEPEGLHQVVRAHDRVNTCAVSADGRLLLSGGWNGDARLWLAESGEWLADLPRREGRMWCAFAGGDQLLVTVDRIGDVSVHRWNGIVTVPVARAGVDVGEVRDVAAVGAVLAVAGSAGVRLRSLPDLAEDRLLTGRDDVTCCALGADGLLVTGHADGTLSIWPGLDAATPLRRRSQPAGERVTCCAVAADGDGFITGGTDGALRRWTATGEPVWEEWVGEQERDRVSVQACALDARAVRAVVGLMPGVVQTWDVVTPAVLARASAHAGYVSSVALTADGTTAVSSSVDGTVRLWDPRLPSEVDTEPYAAQPLTLTWNADGTRVTTVDVYGAVRSWRIASLAGTPPHTFMTCQWYCSAAAVQPGTDRVATVDLDGAVELWTLGADSRRIRRLEIESASACEWVGELLVVATSEGVLSGWDPGTGRELWSRELPDSLHVLAADGRDGTVLAGARSGRVTVVEAATGRAEELPDTDSRGSDSDAVVCAVVRDGAAVVGTAGGHVRCWSRVGSGWTPRWRRRGHDGYVLAVAAAPAPLLAATVGADGRLCLWPADGAEPRRIDAHEAPARHLAVGARGRLAVTAAEDKRALVWSLPTGRPVGEVPLAGDGQAVAIHPTHALVACCDTATGVYVVKPRHPSTAPDNVQ